jgi:hypothetical protein
MKNVTIYLKNQIDSAYDADFISTMDDVINAENMVNEILNSGYKNADYEYLNSYAQTARDRLFDEIGK